MTTGWGQFGHKGHNVNKLSRGTWWCYITNVNVLCLVVSDKNIFPIDSYSKRASSQAGPLNIPCA